MVCRNLVLGVVGGAARALAAAAAGGHGGAPGARHLRLALRAGAGAALPGAAAQVPAALPAGHCAARPLPHIPGQSISIPLTWIIAPGYPLTIQKSFLLLQMVGNKFLHDDGEDDEVISSEWAASGDMDLKQLNKLELEFLDAIVSFSIFYSPNQK